MDSCQEIPRTALTLVPPDQTSDNKYKVNNRGDLKHTACFIKSRHYFRINKFIDCHLKMKHMQHTITRKTNRNRDIDIALLRRLTFLEISYNAENDLF